MLWGGKEVLWVGRGCCGRVRGYCVRVEGVLEGKGSRECCERVTR